MREYILGLVKSLSVRIGPTSPTLPTVFLVVSHLFESHVDSTWATREEALAHANALDGDVSLEEHWFGRPKLPAPFWHVFLSKDGELVHELEPVGPVPHDYVDFDTAHIYCVAPREEDAVAVAKARVLAWRATMKPPMKRYSTDRKLRIPALDKLPDIPPDESA